MALKTVKFFYNESEINSESLVLKLKELGYTADKEACMSNETPVKSTKTDCAFKGSKPACCSGYASVKSGCVK